ncbi:MAG: class I SAM-dependent methyltransferase [Aquimonas sp.]|nr:class I SAM-dependent methyltransferase [Aquimonas sp.]
MRGFETLRSELSVLRQCLRGMPRRGQQAGRLDAFYGPQAEQYDRFRERLLHGRAELIAALDLPQRARVLELGGGTGRNLEFFPEQRRADLHFELVDLCAPLLEVAKHRTRDWPSVRITLADACSHQPDQPVDCVYFSYSLSMIPDWGLALDNALRNLNPGGLLAAVDFHVSSACPPPGRASHSALARAFWPRWFGHDGVQLGPERLDALCKRLPRHALLETSAPVPYMPGLRVPYYRFIGRKPG